MKMRKILAVGMNSLLSLGLSSSLAQNQQLSLAECNTEDLQILNAEISLFEPDVILVSNSSVFAVDTLLGSLLAAFPNLRVIVVQEDSNWLNVYSNQAINLTHISDLQKVIDDQ